ncbi:MAG: GNAT family N-acetyltransferase, partial [Enterobacteriaceae bacterium]
QDELMGTGAHFANLLENEHLLQHFHNAPPKDFSVSIDPTGLLWFLADFNLLTTMEPEVKRRVQQWPLYRYWGNWLIWHTRFIGSTVSEYAPLPGQIPPAELAQQIQQQGRDKTKLTIIKDLPCQSPLLSEQDNAYSAEFTRACEALGFISMEGQALAYVPLDFTSIEEYLGRMSRSRRKDMRRKLKLRSELRVEIVPTGDASFQDPEWLAQLYRYFLAVYEQSDIHFDLLTAPFFQQILQDPYSQGRLFLYWHGEQLVGYNLCYVHKGILLDKYIGMDYPLARQYQLYFVSWFENLQYALDHGLRYYVAGWTDPQVKAQLGASFTFTRHLIWVRHPLRRRIVRRLVPLFEGDSQWHQQHQ